MYYSVLKYVLSAALLMVIVLPGLAIAEERTFEPDSLIIPMDTTYQDYGMLEAYGLVYELLRRGVPVDWVIAAGKTYGDVDFHADAEDLQSQLEVSAHGYRGGPFVVDSAKYTDALPVVQAWQLDHPLVSVHRATAAFTGDVSRRLLVAPNIAVFADQSEEIAFGYLNAAAIPMSDGNPWPDKRDNSGEYSCPGSNCCPDCINESDAAGPTTASHTDGALFDAGGAPRYCQFMSMHYKHPASTPEVVAEVREFLQYPVHFIAECQAVNAFENDPGGRLLTSHGLLAGHGSNDVDYEQSDDPFAQADGGYKNPGGSEAAFSLDVGSSYHDNNVVMVSRAGSAPGVDDIWMNGHVDADPTRGKVSYLGGHKHQTRLPISSNPETQGTRYVLNSLFEAPCVADEGQPSLSTGVDGPGGTNAGIETISVCYENSGPGLAFHAVLVLDLPPGAGFLSATGGGVHTAESVTWDLGSLAADVGTCVEVTLSFDAEGSFGFASTLNYDTGLNSQQVNSGPPLVVRYGHVNLLRYAGVVRLPDQLPPNSEIFVEQHPADPALDPARDTEVVAFESALAFPNDVGDLLPGAPPLVFYELAGDSRDTLRMSRAGGKLVIIY
jgi:hypothetical protein